MSLKDTITNDMKSAMKAGESAKLGTIRMLLAAMKQREVDERITLSDTDIIALVEKAIKQRKESIAQFTAGNRADLVEKEEAELKVLAAYMPAQMTDADIEVAVKAAVAEVAATGVSGNAAMGKVMAIVKPKLAGKADMTVVSAKVRAALA
ncbi:MAG: GatB/YqeY domain-containing protein [Burkholderiales bacterium]|nr:MAG: GatB/YqeY domain-containing protein [Betaproteobacteria bacterium]TAG84004.1 MAG: GatB/YqeY domain-containing protein [Burkholderiales bacterium]